MARNKITPADLEELEKWLSDHGYERCPAVANSLRKLADAWDE